VEPVTELRVALTVADFEQAVAFYGDALGLEQLADWSDEQGRAIAFSAGRATLEVFDDAQAARVDAVEAGRRVRGQFAWRSRWPTARRRPVVSSRPEPSRWRSRSSRRGVTATHASKHPTGCS